MEMEMMAAAEWASCSIVGELQQSARKGKEFRG